MKLVELRDQMRPFVVGCILPKAIKDIATQADTEIVDLSMVLSGHQMDLDHRSHPNCDGHRALVPHIMDQIFNKKQISTDEKHHQQSNGKNNV